MGFTFPDGTKLEDLGWTSPAESDLDMQNYKIMSSTADIIVSVPHDRKIIFKREVPEG